MLYRTSVERRASNRARTPRGSARRSFCCRAASPCCRHRRIVRHGIDQPQRRHRAEDHADRQERRHFYSQDAQQRRAKPSRAVPARLRVWRMNRVLLCQCALPSPNQSLLERAYRAAARPASPTRRNTAPPFDGAPAGSIAPSHTARRLTMARTTSTVAGGIMLNGQGAPEPRGVKKIAALGAALPGSDCHLCRALALCYDNRHPALSYLAGNDRPPVPAPLRHFT